MEKQRKIRYDTWEFELFVRRLARQGEVDPETLLSDKEIKKTRKAYREYRVLQDGTGEYERVLIPFGVRNGNNRIYLRESIVNLDDIIERAKNKALVGECGHPDETRLETNSGFLVHLQNASHYFTQVWAELDMLVGTVRPILNTAGGAGDVLDTMIDAFVFRPRSTGSIGKDGVCENINIIAFDAVLAETDAWKGKSTLIKK